MPALKTKLMEMRKLIGLNENPEIDGYLREPVYVRGEDFEDLINSPATPQLNENVEYEDATNKIIQKFPELTDAEDFIVNTIKATECQFVRFHELQHNISGATGHDGIYLSPNILNEVGYTLFTLFHELAHSYQFRKYGVDKMYSVYLGKIDYTEAAEWLIHSETVADRFAVAKINELNKKFSLNINGGRYLRPQIPLNMVAWQIRELGTMVRNKGIKNPEEITEIIFNTISVNKK